MRVDARWAAGAAVLASAAVQEAAITGGLHELYPLSDALFLGSLVLLAVLGFAIGRPRALALFALPSLGAFSYALAEGVDPRAAAQVELVPLHLALIGVGLLLRQALLKSPQTPSRTA
jgi:hypothetical protein